jgi:hypothetical protein
VSGVVFDEFGGFIRGARVFYDRNEGGSSRETFTNSRGSYVLEDLPGNLDGLNVLVKSTVRIDGVDYFGQNLVSVFNRERSKNLNIILYPTRELARIRGRVFDRNGNALSGARVFAVQASGDTPTSAYGVTDREGFYEIAGLRADAEYNLQSNARGYQTDFVDGIVLARAETRTLDFTLRDSNNPLLPAPAGLQATAWTSPLEVTRSREQRTGIEAIKRMIKPSRRSAPATRTTPNGWPIEVELEWDALDINALLGFGIYRGSSLELLNGIDLLRDPLASFFADNSSGLSQDTTYFYAITALNTDFADVGGDGESAFSNGVSAETLGALENPAFSDVLDEFSWRAASGAEEYLVYIFDNFPTVNDSLRFTSPAVSGTAYRYSGPALAPGRYWFVVVGFANSRASVSISPIADFTVR